MNFGKDSDFYGANNRLGMVTFVVVITNPVKTYTEKLQPVGSNQWPSSCETEVLTTLLI